jgi:hypothetical protein
MKQAFMRSSRATILAGALLAGGLAIGPVSAAFSQEISLPEKLLFQTNHFSNVKQPTKLKYVYRQEAATPDAFSDDASVDVVKANPDGTAEVAARFLSGTHEIPIPAIEHAQGNPVILGFLERDIAEMKRLTGGATGYFRKRIRLALAAPNVPVRKIEVSYQGRQVSAQEITIHPYLDDPLKDRFGKFVGKTYVFIVSDAIPGSLYRVYTTVEPEKEKAEKADKTDKSTPAIDASLTIAQGSSADLKKNGLAMNQH